MAYMSWDYQPRFTGDNTNGLNRSKTPSIPSLP